MPGGTWITAKRDLLAGKRARFANFIGHLFMTNGEEIFSSTDAVSWGDDNLINTVPILSLAYANPKVTLTLAEGHEVEVGNSIVLAGITKVIPITNVAYSTPDVTLTVASGHEVQTGEEITLPLLKKTIAITNVAYAAPNVTLTVGAGHGVLPGNIINISSLDFEYNGLQTVTSVTATSIVFQLAGLDAPVDTAGSLEISEENYYINITGVAYSDPTVTLTVPTGHNIIAGTQITVSGLDAAYNGVHTVTSAGATTVVFQKAALAAPVDTTGTLLAAFYSGPHTVTSATNTTIVFAKTGLATPVLKTGTLSAPDSDYSGVHTVTEITATTASFGKDGIVSTAPLSMGYFTFDFTLAGKDILEYSNLLYIIGLKNFESDIIWCEIPTKNPTTNEYEISWSKFNALSISAGDGEDLVGGAVCRGSLYLFKPSSIARAIAPLEDNGYKDLSKNIGASDRRNIEVVDEKLVFYCSGLRNAKRGFYTFDPLADNTPKIVSEVFQPYIDGMDASTEVVAGVSKDQYIAYIGPVNNPEKGIQMDHCYIVYNVKDNKCMGVWDLGRKATDMDQLTVLGTSELCMGDDDGKIWILNYGEQDGLEITSYPIEFEAISQIYDISKDETGTRSNYIKRSVKNIWIYGDALEGLEFMYRFNPKSSDIGGWRTVRGLRSPVHHIPVKALDVYTWQYGFKEISRRKNSPVIRKVKIEFE